MSANIVNSRTRAPLEEKSAKMAALATCSCLPRACPPSSVRVPSGTRPASARWPSPPTPAGTIPARTEGRVHYCPSPTTRVPVPKDGKVS